MSRSRGHSPDSSDRGAESDNDFLRLPRSTHRHRQQRLISRASSISPRRSSSTKRPIRGFTKDWIDQFLSGPPRTERSNWLSDDSGSDSNSFLTNDHYLHQERSDDWLGLGEGGGGSSRTTEEPESTPRQTDGRSLRNRIGKKGKRRSRHDRTEILRQEDIWGFAYGQDPPPPTMSETVNDDRQLAATTEKPLPSISQGEAPSSLTAAAAAPNPKSVSVRPRPKKKIAWRGKACIIALPIDDKRGSEASGYRLLTVEDVNQRLKTWQDQGYDVRGFTISSPGEAFEDAELGGLSRPAHPDPTECQEEWNARRYTISFPDKAEWDAYVNFLQEEKLRALGVSFGDDQEAEEEEEVQDEARTSSPMLPSVTQAAASAFPGLVATPPIPTASAPANLVHPFSPACNQSPAVGMGLLASPGSQLGLLESYQHQYPIQATPPVQGLLNNPATMYGNMPNLSTVLSPVSALNSAHNFPSADDSFDAAEFERKPFSQNESQVHTLPSSFPEVEIAHPTPRGHGHNLSETLQKGLEAPNGCQSEEQRESGSGDKLSGLTGSRWAVPDDHQKPHGGDYPFHLVCFVGIERNDSLLLTIRSTPGRMTSKARILSWRLLISIPIRVFQGSHRDLRME